MTTININAVNKIFTTGGADVIALKDINLEIASGEFICLLGPSGCGKSTLLNAIAGFSQPTSGQILAGGKLITEPGPDRGMVFQGYTLFPWLNVKHNVMFGLQMQGINRVTSESEAMNWIELVGLSKFTEAYPHQLSGGMKQRVAIARALANKPRILLMDEPFGALDAQTRSKMQANLLEIWRNIDITVLFITHDLDEAIYLADRILVLKANPGEVDELIEVSVPRPRNAGQFISPEFLATKKRLEELIHPPIAEDDADGLHMIRMAHVGDDVEVME